jgi:hypothetical protein
VTAVSAPPAEGAAPAAPVAYSPPPTEESLLDLDNNDLLHEIVLSQLRTEQHLASISASFQGIAAAVQSFPFPGRPR